MLTTFLVSMFAALFDGIFPRVFDLPPPEQLLGLSLWGVDHLFLWQFFTYIFVHPISNGLSFSFLLSLAFSLYLVWAIGTSIIERRGIGAFLSLYLSSAVFVGLFVFWLQSYMHPTIPFAGNTATIYAILLAWIMLYPEAQLLFLLALPIKAKWLVLIILAANLLIDISVGEWLNGLAYLGGALFGYLYSLTLWGVKGPFAALHPIEETFLKLFGRDKRRAASQGYSSRAKIYDFKTGKAILNDEEFLEEMLSKISLLGKGSLTWRERFRLRRISKKKKKS
ncbi:MAG: rhomboid family intramembrane serine protease [Chlamydiales bacterium]|nr:rhomboid family intramembrane serine protease [Chlamydiales bacterium]